MSEKSEVFDYFHVWKVLTCHFAETEEWCLTDEEFSDIYDAAVTSLAIKHHEGCLYRLSESFLSPSVSPRVTPRCRAVGEAQILTHS